MKALDDSGGFFESQVHLRVVNYANEADLLLKKAKKEHLLSFSMDHGIFRQTTPFFYEDSRRAFLVIPPPPTLNFHRSEQQSYSISSGVFAGKAEFLSQVAFQGSLKPEPEPQPLASKVQMSGWSTLSGEFFGTGDSEDLIIRPANSPAFTPVEQNEEPTAINNKYFFGSSSDNLSTSTGLPYQNLTLLPEGDYFFRTFYHPYTCLFLKQLNRYGIEGLLNPDPGTPDGRVLKFQETPDHYQTFDFNKEYVPNTNEVRYLSDHPKEIITFDYDDPYASYNWELFFHIPLLIATRLYQDQRFEAAQQWFHYIFNPTETEGEAPYRFWQIKPFHTYTQQQMESDLKLLLKGKNKSQIRAWQEDPFNPHILARFRPLAYMKTTVMKYLDNLIAWGDMLFCQDSIESLNEATQLYVLAGQILGKLPLATEAKDTQVRTFSQLAAQLDALGNGWVEIELNQENTIGDDSPDGNSFAGHPDLVPYFCFPPNEKLLAYWDTVADRLFKIRHCMNMEGQVRQLPVFQPPIDPALLVRAAASGMDLSSALNDLFAPLPHYRFGLMVQRAQEICQELKSLGGALLSALEKKDAEELSLIRAQQETTLLQANRDIRIMQIKDAKYNLNALREGMKLTKIKHKHYEDIEFMNPAEIAAFILARSVAVVKASSAAVAAGGSAANQAPDQSVGIIAGPSGGATSNTGVGGGDKAAKSISSGSKWLELIAIILKDLAEANATMGSYLRRQEEWDLQRDLAQQEMKQIEQEILGGEVRMAIAEWEQINLDLKIAQSQTVADFMKFKYTQQELYGWMAGQLASVYFQTYRLAYDLAKQAEKTFRYELGIEKSDYILKRNSGSTAPTCLILSWLL